MAEGDAILPKNENFCFIPSAHGLSGISTKNRPPCLGDADRVRLRESVNSREVCRSLTWHSSKSESALERFEPVAMIKL